jgi:predicted nucleic acid-binding protein
MVLVDTSVWIAHFRNGLPALADALVHQFVLLHPVVIGELATGNLRHRGQTLAYLRQLPQVEIGTFNECLQFLETHQLFGRGIGWNDLHLLVSATLSHAPLWTLDKRLADAATEMGLCYTH